VAATRERSRRQIREIQDNRPKCRRSRLRRTSSVQSGSTGCVMVRSSTANRAATRIVQGRQALSDPSSIRPEPTLRLTRARHSKEYRYCFVLATHDKATSRIVCLIDCCIYVLFTLSCPAPCSAVLVVDLLVTSLLYG
jgi:hypothetical protein